MLEQRRQSSLIVASPEMLRLDLCGEMARVGLMAKASNSASKRRAKIFADLTGCLEDAHDHAVAGQNSKLQGPDVIAAIEVINSHLERARRLLESAQDISE